MNIKKLAQSAGLQEQIMRELRLFSYMLQNGDIHRLDKAGLIGDLSAEIEGGLIPRNKFCGGHYCLNSMEIIDALESLDEREIKFAPEFSRSSIEANLVTPLEFPGLNGTSSAFHRLYVKQAKMLRMILQEAERQDAVFLRVGLLGTVPREDLSRGLDIISSAVRYKLFYERLSQRHGSYELNLPLRCGGETLINIPASPVAAGTTNSYQACIGFNPNQFGQAANLMIATSWLRTLIAASSPFAFGEICAHCTRALVWSPGMDPTLQLSPFGPGSYFQENGRNVFNEWLQIVAQQEEVLPYDNPEANKNRSGMFAGLSLLMGTYWVWSGRLRFGLQDSMLDLYYEDRSPDTGLTIMDDVANTAVCLGYIAYCIKHGIDARGLTNYREAERCVDLVARHGLSEKAEHYVTWRGRKLSVMEVLLDDYLPNALAGLQDYGFADCLAEKLVGVVTRRIEKKLTASDWLVGLYQKLERMSPATPPLEIIREVYLRTAEMQNRQSDTMDFVGIADIEF
ncbi:MAG: hypothetical protein PHC51_01845 [bacterium]|nr:hypothetical protein [bacterium]